MPVQNDLQTLAMAYMDIPPESESNGKTVVLMHGKAFGGYYFEHVIEALTTAGYRVVVLDQIGWGKSSKPDIHYSFHLFATNTAALLDHLGVGVGAPGHPLPGGYIVEGEHFLVEHAPLQESSAGTVIVETQRHLLDFGEMTPTESAELGPLLHRLVPAIKAATEVQRVYFLAVMERAATSISGSYRRRTRENFAECSTWRSSPLLRPRKARQKRYRGKSELSSSRLEGSPALRFSTERQSS
jgi:hypothetical protein